MRSTALAIVALAAVAVVGIVYTHAITGGARVTVISLADIGHDPDEALQALAPLADGVYCDAAACCGSAKAAISVDLRAARLICEGAAQDAAACACPLRGRLIGID